jgi:sec-independent protein translocase protein TatA
VPSEPPPFPDDTALIRVTQSCRRTNMNLGIPELLIVLAVVLLLFGSTKLPKLARSLGEASKEFRSGQHEDAATKD